eukprot:scpid112976/ scgid5811/ 
MSATVYCPQWRTLYSNHFDKKLLSADLSPCLRHSQAPPPVVSYPPAPVPAAAQPHSNDGRYGDKLHGLSESLSRIDVRAGTVDELAMFHVGFHCLFLGEVVVLGFTVK